MMQLCLKQQHSSYLEKWQNTQYNSYLIFVGQEDSYWRPSYPNFGDTTTRPVSLQDRFDARASIHPEIV